MKHYSAGQWSDFVRQLISSAERAAMLEHLSSCSECKSTVGSLEAMIEVARLDASIAVPPEVTERARTLFGLKPSDHGWFQGLRKLAAELVYERSRDFLPAGVRVGATAGTAELRHLSFRAGEYNVDLRLEPGEAGVSEIIGQIVNSLNRAEPVEGLLVQIIAAGRTVGETETNRFGEFVLERPLKPAATLRICLRAAGCWIELPLRKTKRA